MVAILDGDYIPEDAVDVHARNGQWEGEEEGVSNGVAEMLLSFVYFRDLQHIVRQGGKEHYQRILVSIMGQESCFCYIRSNEDYVNYMRESSTRFKTVANGAAFYFDPEHYTRRNATLTEVYSASKLLDWMEDKFLSQECEEGYDMAKGKAKKYKEASRVLRRVIKEGTLDDKREAMAIINAIKEEG